MQITALKSKFIPAKSLSSKNPVLALVHGRTGNLKLLEWYSKRFDIPELSYLMIEAPFADQREGQTEPGFSWYLKGRERISESRDLLLRLVREIDAQGIPTTSFFWMGFSQGGVMGLDLALRAPFQLGGVICVSGLCVEPEAYPAALGKFAAKQKILITHGTRDEIISLEEAEKSYEVLKRCEIPYQYRVFDKPHSFHLKEEVPFLEETLKNWIRG